MGFLNFLKPKKGLQKEETGVPGTDFQEQPQFPSESELYSELPNLPEAPETSSLPEIDLPQWPKNMTIPREEPEPLLPNWPPASTPTFPELPTEKPEHESPAPWLKLENDSPEQLPAEETAPSFASYSGNGRLFLKADDFHMIKGNMDDMIRIQRKHHKLTGLKKEENQHYDSINVAIEDAQRKLMHVDRILFERMDEG